MTIFQDPEQIQARARAVHRLLDSLPHRAVLYASETRAGYPHLARPGDTEDLSADHVLGVYDAVSHAVSYLDADATRRTIKVPRGATDEAIASLVYALATVQEWREPAAPQHR